MDLFAPKLPTPQDPSAGGTKGLAKSLADLAGRLSEGKLDYGQDPRDEMFRKLVAKHMDAKRARSDAFGDSGRTAGRQPQPNLAQPSISPAPKAVGEPAVVEATDQKVETKPITLDKQPEATAPVLTDTTAPPPPAVAVAPIDTSTFAVGADDAGLSPEELLAEGAKASLQMQASGGLPKGAQAPATTPEGKSQPAAPAQPAAGLDAELAADAAPQAPPPGGAPKVTVTDASLVSRPQAALASAAATLQQVPESAPATLPAAPATAGLTVEDSLAAGANSRGNGQPGTSLPNQPQQAQEPPPAAPNAQAAQAQQAAKPGPAQQPARAAEAPAQALPQADAAGQGLGTQNGSSAAKAAERTAPPPPPRASTPAQFAIADQVAVQIHRAVKSGLDRISIQLKPHELGRVDVVMEVAQDGRIQGVIQAEKQETLDLLMRDAKHLERALQDAGFDTGSNGLKFALRGDGEGGRSERELARLLGRDAGGAGTAEEEALAAAAAAPAARSDGGIDIRV